MHKAYTTEEITREISVEAYIAHYHNPDKVWGYCHACGNYGRQWSCPPFDFDVTERLSKYNSLQLIATKITLHDRSMSPCEMEEFLRPQRVELEERLLELERTHHGLACTFIGKCLHCEDECCSRRQGKPCRHPKLVRPSLEAYGFDVAKTLSELFDIELQWSQNGSLPEYLVLVCGVFYNV